MTMVGTHLEYIQDMHQYQSKDVYYE